MDKSPKYIKMCDCPEIQEGWKPAVGDWTDKGIVVKVFKDRVWLAFTESGTTIDRHKSELIWLPRQDQTQGMVMPERNFPFNQVGDLIRWIDNYKSYSCSFDSMEQLWLAFVMCTLQQMTLVDEKGWVK